MNFSQTDFLKFELQINLHFQAEPNSFVKVDSTLYLKLFNFELGWIINHGSVNEKYSDDYIEIKQVGVKLGARNFGESVEHKTLA